MDQYFGICHLSLIPLRAAASDKSEILSQLLFGDGFEVLETADNWTFIRTRGDDYEGWIDSKQYMPLTASEFEKLNAPANVLGISTAQKVKKLSTGEVLYLTAGCSIPSVVSNRFFLGNEEFELTDPVFSEPGDFAGNIISCSRFFLHAPYLWGGRSVFGIDCSGFTQIVFKMLGISLKRDAWQQAEQGSPVNFLQEARAGDLAFFDNAEGRITHVGIMLNDQEIIHASGRVKIDPVDDQGIYSLDLKKHSHKLRIIKRYI